VPYEINHEFLIEVTNGSMEIKKVEVWVTKISPKLWIVFPYSSCASCFPKKEKKRNLR
jgi:hypothetical protein